MTDDLFIASSFSHKFANKLMRTLILNWQGIGFSLVEGKNEWCIRAPESLLSDQVLLASIRAFANGFQAGLNIGTYQSS
jgi:hypothetical protein